MRIAHLPRLAGALQTLFAVRAGLLIFLEVEVAIAEVDVRVGEAARHVDRIAVEAHLTPEDLLNNVNAWSDEALGDFLFERKENVRIYRNLLPDAAMVAIAA